MKAAAEMAGEAGAAETVAVDLAAERVAVAMVAAVATAVAGSACAESESAVCVCVAYEGGEGGEGGDNAHKCSSNCHNRNRIQHGPPYSTVGARDGCFQHRETAAANRNEIRLDERVPIRFEARHKVIISKESSRAHLNRLRGDVLAHDQAEHVNVVGLIRAEHSTLLLEPTSPRGCFR